MARRYLSCAPDCATRGCICVALLVTVLVCPSLAAGVSLPGAPPTGLSGLPPGMPPPATASAASAAPVLQRIQQTGVMRIAYRESSIPFSYLAHGRPVGYAIDLCLRVVEAVRIALKQPQLRVDWLPVNSVTRIPAIVEGRADLECGSTTNTSERRRQVAFTVPHFIASIRMLVRADSPIRNWSDLVGRTVVSSKGTTPLRYIHDMNAGEVLRLKVIEGKDHAESFALLESGQAEAFVMDDVLLYGARAGAAAPGAYRIAGDALTVEPYAIMLAPDDAEFKKIVDKALIGAIYEGETQRLYRKWFLSPIAPNGVVLDIPMNYLLRDSFKFPSDKVAD